MTPPGMAMVLAAGRGERMQPLTRNRAKPTLPVLGVPMLVRAIRSLAGLGVRHACVNAWHAADSVQDALSRFDLGGLEASLFVEKRLMGSGGAFAAPAARLAEDELFVAINADTLLAPPLERLASAVLDNPARIGALLIRPGMTAGYGAVAIEGDLFRGVAAEGGEDPAGATLATYLGVAVFRRELLEGVPTDSPSHLFADVVMPRLHEGRELAVVPFDGPWLEFTSPESYRRSLIRLVQGGRSAGAAELPGGAAKIDSLPGGALFAAEDTIIEPGAILEGAVVLERRARVARGAMLENSVLLEDARVSACASLARAVVGSGARVPGGANCRDSVYPGPAARDE